MRTIDEIGSQTPPRTIWDLDSDWREINFLFYSFNKTGKIRFLTSKLSPPFNSYEKQNAVNLLTEKLANGDEFAINKINSTIKGNIEIRHITSIFQAKNYLKKYFNENNISLDDMKWIENGNSLCNRSPVPH